MFPTELLLYSTFVGFALGDGTYLQGQILRKHRLPEPPLLDGALRISEQKRLLKPPRPRQANEVAEGNRKHVSVDYGGVHPFERELGEPTSDNEYKPIRFRFITEPLEASRGISNEHDEKLDLILDTVLPFVESTWSRHLSVFPPSNIPVGPSACFGFFDEEIPLHLKESGVTSADIAIFVSAKDFMITSRGQKVDVCNGSRLASAKTCALDQHDRPNIGYINFCLSEDKLNTPAQILDTSLVGVHELGHLLGMDSDLFRFFRDPDTGKPLTPRPFRPVEVTCLNGATTKKYFPSENTLQRGRTNKGLHYFEVVTPRVRTVTRNHFDCQSLAGARLENQPTSSSCSGDHWDERLFSTEIMSAIFSGGGEGRGAVLSPLTLALMEDSGWYRVSYKNSSLPAFGHGRGCGFASGDCIVNNGVPKYGKDIFCNSTANLRNGQFSQGNDIFCDPSHTSFALCDLFDLSDQPNPFGIDPLRDDVRYFSNKQLTTARTQGDFCPMPSILLGLDCTDASSNPGRKFYHDEEYGPGSRCINAFIEYSKNLPKVQYPACLSTHCDERSRKVIVNGRQCNFDGEIHQISAIWGHFIECPVLKSICPHFFCPSGCSARGTCDFQADPPRCNCFDSTDLSPDCSESEGNTQTVPSAAPIHITSAPPNFVVDVFTPSAVQPTNSPTQDTADTNLQDDTQVPSNQGLTNDEDSLNTSGSLIAIQPFMALSCLICSFALSF